MPALARVLVSEESNDQKIPQPETDLLPGHFTKVTRPRDKVTMVVARMPGFSFHLHQLFGGC